MDTSGHAEQPPYKPVSMEMQYGPMPPPDLDADPTTAQWIADEVDGDPYLYQMEMLIDSLGQSWSRKEIDPEAYLDKYEELRRAIRGYKLSGREPEFRYPVSGRDFPTDVQED